MQTKKATSNKKNTNGNGKKTNGKAAEPTVETVAAPQAEPEAEAADDEGEGGAKSRLAKTREAITRSTGVLNKRIELVCGWDKAVSKKGAKTKLSPAQVEALGEAAAALDDVRARLKDAMEFLAELPDDLVMPKVARAQATFDVGDSVEIKEKDVEKYEDMIADCEPVAEVVALATDGKHAIVRLSDGSRMKARLAHLKAV